MVPIDQLDWDHVRVFLAAMRSRSLRQAAEGLGLSHPTARRRLIALEQQLGLQLFDRRPDGLHPTLEAAAVQRAAEDVERAMHALGRVAQATDPEIRGSIRVTMPDMAASELLMDDLVAFQLRWPNVELHVDASYGLADLGKREADVAIRFFPPGKLPDEHLMGRLAATAYSAVYGSGEHWIGWRGTEQDAEWIAQSAFPDLPARGAINNGLLQVAACAAGLGLTQLPCFVAEPRLERRTKPQPGFDIWVLVHPDLRRSPRLRLFRDAMVTALQRQKLRLRGGDRVAALESGPALR